MNAVEERLTLTLVQTAYEIEAAGEDDVQPDVAVRLLEGIAAALQALPDEDRAAVVELVRRRGREEADPGKASFLRSLPEDFGLLPDRA